VRRELKDRENIKGMGLSLQRLLSYAYEGESTVNRIVTGDESWVHHYQPESNRTSMQSKYSNSQSHKKFQITRPPSAGKVMLAVFAILGKYC
jgi:hypothetical protein